jgi:hypothetical protein
LTHKPNITAAGVENWAAQVIYSAHLKLSFGSKIVNYQRICEGNYLRKQFFLTKDKSHL